MTMVELSLKSTIDVNTSAEKLKLNRKEAKRRLQNLIMTKTANYAARWLYRSLKSSF
jgi:predicted ArsR family transcriptional regulator